MKKLLIVIVVLITRISSYAQDPLFDGIYKGSSKGISYTLYLKNIHGVIDGTIRNSERATIESVITAAITNTNYIKGIQKEKRKKIRFMAIEESNQIIWEMKSWFLKRIFSKKDRIIKYIKIGSNNQASSPDQSGSN